MTKSRANAKSFGEAFVEELDRVLPKPSKTTFYLAFAMDISRTRYSYDGEEIIDEEVTGNLFFEHDSSSWTPDVEQEAYGAIMNKVRGNTGANHVYEPTITFMTKV